MEASSKKLAKIGSVAKQCFVPRPLVQQASIVRSELDDGEALRNVKRSCHVLNDCVCNSTVDERAGRGVTSMTVGSNASTLALLLHSVPRAHVMVNTPP